MCIRDRVLLADLPTVGPLRDPYPRSLDIPAEPTRVARWKGVLEESGPRPWIGITWRAGLPGQPPSRALSKNVPPAALATSVAALRGTVLSLQRDAQPGEIEAAGAALGHGIVDLAAANADLEDALALVALLDRHIGVSSTNMHLAAAAGRSADVLVPFPPEWRWGAEGAATPWFPGFRVHRQRRDGDWSEALAAIAR